MDHLKTLEELLQPDLFNLAHVVVNRETGQVRPIVVSDLHHRLSEITLYEKVPEDIRSYFEVIRNLYLYGWFCHEFLSIGAFHALAAVEMGLRKKLGYDQGERSPGLKRLLEESRRQGLLADDGFSIVKATQKDSSSSIAAFEVTPGQPTSEYCSILAQALPYLRNEFAHPASYMVMGGSDAFAILQVAADLINQLFKGKLHE